MIPNNKEWNETPYHLMVTYFPKFEDGSLGHQQIARLPYSGSRTATEKSLIKQADAAFFLFMEGRDLITNARVMKTGPVKSHRRPVGSLTRKRNPVKKTRRKKRRTPAQKRATAKLIAMNKRRGKTQRKAAPKKRPLTPAQRRAVKTRKKERGKVAPWGIRVIVGKPKKHVRWYTGKGFVKRSQFIDHPPKHYATSKAALAAYEKVKGRFPPTIISVEISTITSQYSYKAR